MTVVSEADFPPGGDTDHLRLGPDLALVVRLLAAHDAAALQHHVRGLSPRSRHSRYLGALNALPPAEISRLVEGVADGSLRVLLAEGAAAPGPALVGEAVYVPDAAAGTAELALSVADAWQGRGIGTALVESIACRAARAGIRLLHGEILRGNEAMRRLAARTGFVMTRHGDPRLVRIERVLAGGMAPCALSAARKPAASRCLRGGALFRKGGRAVRPRSCLTGIDGDPNT